MEDWVLEYVEDIRDYNARPNMALYAATRLADAMIAGRLEDWRAVRDAVWSIPNPWRPNGNKAVVQFNRKLWWDHNPTTLNAARERYLREQAGLRNREPYTETVEDIDHSDPGYWESRNGDLSAADLEAEEKFE